MQVCVLLLHFVNLNRLSFHPILTYDNPLSMEEHISTMLHPGMWGTHIEILAAATYYNVALYYSCYNAEKGHYWEQHQLLLQRRCSCHYLDLSGSTLENIPQPHYFKLAYTTNCHYDSTISITEKLCTIFPY